MSRPIVLVFIILLFCLAILTSCSPGFMRDPLRYDKYHLLPFDETQWKTERIVWVENTDEKNMSKIVMQKMSKETCRAKMIGDLLENHLHPGMTKESIEELLGPPEYPPYFLKNGTECWCYELSIRDFEPIKGPSGGHRFVIHLNHGDKYIASKIELE